MKTVISWLMHSARPFMTTNDMGVAFPVIGLALGLGLYAYIDDAHTAALPFRLFLMNHSMEPTLWIYALLATSLVSINWKSYLMRGLNFLVISSFVLAIIAFAFETRVTPPFVLIIEVIFVPMGVLLLVLTSLVKGLVQELTTKDFLLNEALITIQRLENEHAETSPTDE